MRPESKNAFVLASILHLVFVGLLLFFSVWQPLKKEPEPVVMTLFAPPAPMDSEPVPEPEPEIETVSFDFKPVPLVPIPPPPPDPAPPPPPKPKPDPKPEPKPAPKPEPPPPPKVSYQEFRQKNPEPKPKPPRQNPPAPSAPPVTVPRIDTSKIVKSLETMMSRETAERVSRQSPSDQAALHAYFERVKATVRGAWAKPAGLHDQLRVSISFHISADGRISGARVASSSGNAIFDQSVLAAFNRAGSVGPTPDGNSYPLRLEFRMTDG